MTKSGRNIIVRLLFIVLLLSAHLCLHADRRYAFNHYDTGNGLPQNTVNCITQDKMGFIWIGTKNGLCRFDGTGFQTYRSGMGNHGPGNDNIKGLCAASDGRLWVATAQGVYIYDPRKDSFSRFGLRNAQGAAVGNCYSVEEHRGAIYIMTNADGLFMYDLKSSQLRQFSLLGLPTVVDLSFSGNTIWLGLYGGGLKYTTDNFRSIHAAKDSYGREILKTENVSGIISSVKGKLYLGSNLSGLSEVDLRTRQVRQLLPKWDLKGNYVHAVCHRGNEIWAATENGIYVYRLSDGNLEHYVYESTNPYSMPDNSVQCLYADKESGMWAGSYFGGVACAPLQSTHIEKFFPRVDKPESLHGRHVRNLVEDSQKRIWVATEDGGLDCYNMSTGKFSHIAASDAFPNIHSLCIVGHELWVGTFAEGLHVMDLGSGRIVKSYMHGSGSSLIDDNIYAIRATRNGQIYIGTLAGLCAYQPASNSFASISGLPPHIVNDIMEDSGGDLWVAYDGEGLYRRHGQKWMAYTTSNGSQLSDDKVIALFEDSRGTIWACTEGGGVNRFDHLHNRFRLVDVQKSDPRITVFQIQEDDQGQLWMSTLYGLLCYDPATGNSRLYTTANGLLDNSFNYSSSLYASDGRIYLGSSSGMIAFSPKSFLGSSQLPLIVATDLMVNNKRVYVGESGSPLEENIIFQHKLRLRHEENSFSIRFSVISFSNLRSGVLEYRLEGFDKKWQTLVGDGYVKYTNLPSGRYRLQVRSIGSDGKPLAKAYEMAITVRPPLYLSWWALLLYILLACAAAWGLVSYQRQRTRIRQRIAIDKFEREKEQELYQSKISFFTNVAHEIRTPLTLIKGPLDAIIKRKHRKEEAEGLGIMSQNVNRLLDLANQLLDFRKAERDGLRLNLVHSNINKLVEDVYVRFTPLMQSKGISHTISLPETTLYANVDKEGFTKIVSNLMNNAVKYCESQMSLKVSTEGDNFYVVVANDGHIINKEVRERIFTPFFRISDDQATTTGTGIGLALARSLAELQGGTLNMDDDEHLNIFRLCLPMSQQTSITLAEPESTDAGDNTEEEQEEQEEQENQRTVLIVEDNADLRNYEQRVLQRHYKVLTAAEGKEALQIVKENNVDVIVSDALMEPMDGFSLCRHIKGDLGSSHIPFIMLTALTLDSAKIKGMEIGVDTYIEKPFSMDYLLSAIENLIRQRENLRRTYANTPLTESATMPVGKVDEEFISRLNKVIDENIHDSDFDINKFASEMAMSRTGLNRKIKGVFNLTPNNYIKLERLKRATKLLKSGKVTVGEVSDMVGFSTSSYFTQCFFKQFGLLPKEFMEQCMNGGNPTSE